VTSRADLEAELFAAQLGAALSILPVKGLLGKPVSQGARAAARSGIREGAQVFATGVRRRSLVLFAQGVKQGLYSSVTREVATMAFMDQAMQHLVTGPFADALRREFPVYDEFDDEPRRE